MVDETSVLIRHMPRDLKARLELKALTDRRSVNNTILILLENALPLLPPPPDPTPAPPRPQVWTPAV